MANYDDVKFLRVTLPSFDFGASVDEVFSFRLPTGWKARLKKIGVMVTETFACDGTVADVQLGTAADPNVYAHLNIVDGAADLDCYDETDDTDAIIAEDIAADTLLRVTLTQSTDGSADAGQGIPFMDFELYQN